MGLQMSKLKPEETDILRYFYYEKGMTTKKSNLISDAAAAANLPVEMVKVFHTK